MKDNHPDCVGHPVPDCEVKLGANDELLVRGPQVMKGYWNRPLDTAAAFEDGWFRTGDQADLSDGGRVRIKGRIKEIIVTSTGEKIPPVDVEFAIQEDRLFEQVLVIGDNLPYVTCLVVVNPKLWPAFCADLDLDPEDPATLQSRDVQRQCLRRVRHACRAFPQYGVPRAVAITREPWTVDNGLLTPTMKLRRPADHDSPRQAHRKALRFPLRPEAHLPRGASEKDAPFFHCRQRFRGRSKYFIRNPPKPQKTRYTTAANQSPNCRTGRDHSRFCRRAGQRMPDPSCTAGVQFPFNARIFDLRIHVEDTHVYFFLCLEVVMRILQKALTFDDVLSSPPIPKSSPAIPSSPRS